MVVERVRQMSVEEFLDFAEQSEEWYEYIDGELYPMTGGRLNHFAISGNITGMLMNLLSGGKCQVIGAGMLVRAGVATLVAPDVSVVCGQPETEAGTRILLNPTVVVEVISPSSINHDRVLKRDLYESVASIAAYLIVEQDQALVELYRRSETGWHLQSFRSLDDEVPLEALDCRLPLRDIYRNVASEDATGADAGA
jgi:Uma2 family endonuclease